MVSITSSQRVVLLGTVLGQHSHSRPPFSLGKDWATGSLGEQALRPHWCVTRKVRILPSKVISQLARQAHSLLLGWVPALRCFRHADEHFACKGH